MAEVGIDSLITPKKDELDEGSMSKSSSGDQDSLSNGHSTDTRNRRKSVGPNHAGRSSSRISAAKSEPNYLRASTGSCHDFCKFGREHSFETIPRKPFRKSIGKPFPNEESPIQIFVSGGKKKEEVISDSKKKEEAVSGGKKEKVISGEKKKEVVSDSKKKEEVVSGGKKEKAISGSKKKEEVVSAGRKKEEVVSVGQKKGRVVSGGRKKEEVVSADREEEEVVSADEKTEEVISIGEKEESVDLGIPTDIVDHPAYKKPSPDTESGPEKPKISLDKENATMRKSSMYSDNHSPNGSSSRTKPSLQKPKQSSKQKDSSGSKPLFPKRKPSSAKKSPSADPPEIVKSVIFPYSEVTDSVKQGSLPDDKILRTVKKTSSLAKQHSIPMKLKSVKVKPSPSSDDSDGVRGKGRKVVASKASAKKISTPPTLTSKPSLNKKAQIKSGKPENLKTASSLKNQSRIRRASSSKAQNGENVSEKTLHVISVENGNNLSECISGDNAIPSSPPSPSSAKPSPHGKSSPFSSKKSDAKVDESISEKNGFLETIKEAAVKDINNKTTRKIRVTVPEEKHASPVKLKFRMGKVVDLQSDNNTPKKLRFRRARLLGAAEDSKGDSRRRTSKRAGINGDTAGTNDPSQKVVLKHQDVQGKKDAQGLLNNVIEETASKLAVSRKSKVKALVGAFETVISLQEVKPSSTQAVS